MKKKYKIVLLGALFIFTFCVLYYVHNTIRKPASLVFDKCVELKYNNSILVVRYPSIYGKTVKRYIKDSGNISDDPEGDTLIILSTTTKKELINIYPYPTFNEKAIVEGLKYKKISDIDGNVAYTSTLDKGFQEILIPIDKLNTTFGIGISSNNQILEDNKIISQILNQVKIQTSSDFVKLSTVTECDLVK